MTNENQLPLPSFKNNNADGNIICRLFRTKHKLREGYMVKIDHYANLYSTVQRDYTTDYYLKEALTDRILIDEVAKKIEELQLQYAIGFYRTKRFTSGTLNGYVGLQEIEIELMDFSKKEDHVKHSEHVILQMEKLRKEMSLPIKYIKSEPPFKYGGTENWNMKIYFKCMPNLKGQTALEERFIYF
jgi:hypothetical protein